jgi:hypothetical protein
MLQDGLCMKKKMGEIEIWGQSTIDIQMGALLHSNQYVCCSLIPGLFVLSCQQQRQ